MISTVYVASECVTNRHIASIIILVLFHFLSLAIGKIFKIVAKLVILVAILYSHLGFLNAFNGVKLTEMVLLIYIRKTICSRHS